MISKKTSQWRLALLAVACSCIVMGSGFMACGSEDTTSQDVGGVGGAGAGSSTCDITQCPDPPFTGLEKCCTADGMCGVRGSATTTCYPPGQSGAGGGGMGGGKL